jgi:hypothetical protein
MPPKTTSATSISQAQKINNNGNYDYYVVKLDSNLVQQWERTYNGADNLEDMANAVKVDNSGNVYVTGYSTTSSQGKNYVTLKYNNSGTLQWTSIYNNPDNTDDIATAMTLDNNGKLYVTGSTHNAQFNNDDFYTIRYNATTGANTGAVTWDSKNHYNDTPTNIMLDSEHNIIIGGLSQVKPSDWQYVTVKYSERDIIKPAEFLNDSINPSFSYYENKGQIITTDTANPDAGFVRFYTNNTYPQLYFQDNNYSMVFASIDTSAATPDTLHRIDVSFEGAYKVHHNKIYSMDEKKVGYLNYFLSQCPDGITAVMPNERLVVPDLYDKIDLQYYSNQKGFKYAFVIKPTGDPSKISHKFIGATSSSIDANGTLNVNSSIGSIGLECHAYQLDNSNNIITLPWNIQWNQVQTNFFSFDLGAYDSTKTLVIAVDRSNQQFSPLHGGTNHEYESYFGGNGNNVGTAVTSDTYGNPYYAGYTNSSVFPISGINIFQPSIGSIGFYDCYLAKFNAANYGTGQGDNRVWVTYFGTISDDFPTGVIAIGDSNNGKVTLTGYSSSNSFAMPSNNQGDFIMNNSMTGKNSFIVRLNNSTGSLNWLTFFGGTGEDIATCINKDNDGNIYIGGKTTTNLYSSNICIAPTDGGFPACNPNNTFNNNNTYGGNTDAFLLKFGTTGNLLYSSFLGGDAEDVIKAITIDTDRNIFVAGKTKAGSNFPFPSTQPSGAYAQTTFGGGGSTEYDGFIVKLSNSQVLLWSTFFGGNADDQITGIDIDLSSSKNLFITGKTSTTLPACTTCTCTVPPTGQFPLCNLSGAFYQPIHGNTGTSSINDAFIAKFSNTGAILWSTYLGGDYNDEATGLVCDKSLVNDQFGSSTPAPNVIICGFTNSVDFQHANPTLTNLFAGAAYLYTGNTNLVNSTIGFDPFIEMFSNQGEQLWGTNYGDISSLPSTTGKDAALAITSTRDVDFFQPVSKSMYLTGYSNHYEHESVTSNNLTAPYTQNPLFTLSQPYNLATLSRFSYLANISGGFNESNLNNNGSILIYPNPSSSAITILLSKVIDATSISTLKIINILGQEILTQQIKNQNKTYIDISNYDKGIYFITIINNNKTNSAKFIKN